MTLRFLDRREAAAFLSTHGFPVATATLAKLASIGNGPTIVHFGRKPLYRPEDLLAWATARCRLRTSTSDPGQPLALQAAPETAPAEETSK